jgi:diaminopropionate ammonia-lyase
MLNPTSLRLFANPRVTRTQAYRCEGRDGILSLAALADARREITSWPGYRATPLRTLSKLAAAAGIGDILYKDESERFGIGSFKAMGGAYAVLRLLQRHILAGVPPPFPPPQAGEDQAGSAISARELASGRHAELASRVTVTCATDGNHGRSVAWGARTFGCKCVIYLPDVVSQGRCRAIEAYGAHVRRVAGTFDDAVRKAAADAAANAWHVISDTAGEDCAGAARDVMQGYGLMIDEACSQCAGNPSHILVQGGVGGLAAAACSYLWERYGKERPVFVVVEPERADCLFRSAVAGRPTPAHGTLDTIMGGLACGEVSLLAWRILATGADAFATIDDEAAAECMRLLAEGRCGDDPIVAGESAVAGLAGLLLACADTDARSVLGLRPDSRVLVLGTEGATDADTYRTIVGRTPDEVMRGPLPGPLPVMAGLVPAIHDLFEGKKNVDGRDKHGHDD